MGRRIAITGSAGTGKTTLGQALAGRLDLPYLAEGMRRRLEAGFDPHSLDFEGMRCLLEELLDEQLGEMAAAEASHGGFIADRTPLDTLGFWLLYGHGFDVTRTDRIAQRCRQAMAGLDLVVLLPWGAIPLVADGIRTPSPWTQLHYQILIEGLLDREETGPPLLKVPLDMKALPDRVAQVLGAV